MGKNLSELKRFSSKVGTLLLAGCVAVAFTPGMAFAHYEYNNTAGETKAIIGNDGDPLGGGIEQVAADGNGKTYDEHTQIYRGYAHSDNGSHYQGYSLYTAMTVDDSGVLTAVDITSGNDTFAGKWGNSQKSSGRTGNNPVNGYLPEGVEFTASQNSDGTWTPLLDGADTYGYTFSAVTLMSVNEDGSADSAGEGTAVVSSTYTGKDKTKIDTVKTTTATVDGKEVTTKDEDYYNLVKCSYQIGNDKTLFDTYFSVGSRAEAANKYIDNCVEDTTWDEYPATGYTTNRDGWTAIMATLTLRQLESWGATMSDPSISTNVDGEIATIDTVSGATKTATPFATALNKAHETGFIKGVSENVQMTIDGARIGETNLPGLKINNAETGSYYQDVVSVKKGADGLYTIEGTFKPYGGGRLSVDAITLYDLSEAKLGTQGVMALSKELSTADNQFEDYKIWQQIPTATNEGGTLKFYNTDDESHILPFDARSEEFTNTFTTTGRGATTYTIAGEEADGNSISVMFRKTDDSFIDYKVQTKDAKATHLAMTYTLGHGRVSSIYDLENLAKVSEVSAQLAAAKASDEASVTTARAAYDALPYDVRPFTTGIGNLELAEAELVAAQLKDVDSSDEAAVAAARAAYDKLDAAAKAQVDAVALKSLTDAEKAVETAKAEAKAAAEEEANLANGTVTVAALTYTGKAQTAKVTVISKSGKTLEAGTDYTVSGNKQTKAGTYTVEVTGTGAYTGTKSAELTVKAAKNAAKAAKTSVKKTYKASKLKKKAKTFALPKVTTTFGTAKWKVTSKDKKKVLSLSGSKIKVKKGAKKKTYTIKLKASVGKTANYAAASTKTVTVKVKVK